MNNNKSLDNILKEARDKSRPKSSNSMKKYKLSNSERVNNIVPAKSNIYGELVNDVSIGGHIQKMIREAERESSTAQSGNYIRDDS